MELLDQWTVGPILTGNIMESSSWGISGKGVFWMGYN